MKWGVKGKVESRLEFVERLMRGERMASLCREYEISRPTGYLWKRRYESEKSVVSLYDRSHRPQSCPHRIPKKVEKRICKLRKQHGWSGRKLRVLLKLEGTSCPVSTINRVIKRNGLLVPEDCHKRALKRFEYEHPNELWQADFKGPMGREEAKCEPLSIIDDHSRFIVGLRAVTSKRTGEMKRVFRDIFEEYGVPEKLLLDHGVPWWSTAHFLGFSGFSVWLMKQDLKLVFSGVSHPQTQGKVERFHRALGCSVRLRGTPRHFQDWKPMLKEIKDEYNYVRPHESLDMKTPSELYRKSKRQFNPNPRGFDYPSDAKVVRLDSQGRYHLNNCRHRVSHALAGEYVQVKDLEYSTLIYYRNTPVREILAKGSTRAVFPPGTWDHPSPRGLLNSSTS